MDSLFKIDALLWVYINATVCPHGSSHHVLYIITFHPVLWLQLRLLCCWKSCCNDHSQAYLFVTLVWETYLIQWICINHLISVMHCSKHIGHFSEQKKQKALLLKNLLSSGFSLEDISKNGTCRSCVTFVLTFTKHCQNPLCIAALCSTFISGIRSPLFPDPKTGRLRELHNSLIFGNLIPKINDISFLWWVKFSISPH